MTSLTFAVQVIIEATVLCGGVLALALVAREVGWHIHELRRR